MDTWTVVSTKGALIAGRTGHAAVYHEASQRIFVFGGYKDTPTQPSRELLIYSPFSRDW